MTFDHGPPHIVNIACTTFHRAAMSETHSIWNDNLLEFVLVNLCYSILDTYLSAASGRLQLPDQAAALVQRCGASHDRAVL